MKKAFLIAVCLAVFSATAQNTSTPAAIHQQKLADIRKLMTLTGSDKMANQMLDQMADSMRPSAGPDFDKYFAEFRKEFDLNKVFEIQVAAYDKYLSAEDVKAMVRFYESPAGKHMTDAMPQIMGDMMAQAMQMSAEISRKVAQKVKEQQ
jgi:hypothetical protein